MKLQLIDWLIAAADLAVRPVGGLDVPVQKLSAPLPSPDGKTMLHYLNILPLLVRLRRDLVGTVHGGQLPLRTDSQGILHGCIKLTILSLRGTSGERTEERGMQFERASSPQPSPSSDGREGEIKGA